uniref:Orf1 n=1 Tax=Motts Mill virus TaxID=1654359 RepID=A0A0F7KNA7_9VIRU|nr:orf1 [Motts Mill virus]
MNKQVQKLSRELALMKVQVSNSVPKPKRKRNKKKKNRSTPGTTGVAIMQSVGQITFGRLEYLGDVVASKAVIIDLKPSSFPYLGTLSKGFERYKWRSMTIHYKPIVGTTAAGAVTLGVDWTNTERNTRKEIAALTPVLDTPVWQLAKLTLPVARLNSRKEYMVTGTDANDCGPGKLCVVVTGATGTVGDLWIQYHLDMYGTC